MGTCFTVIVVPEGMFFVRLFVATLERRFDFPLVVDGHEVFSVGLLVMFWLWCDALPKCLLSGAFEDSEFDFSCCCFFAKLFTMVVKLLGAPLRTGVLGWVGDFCS